MQVMTEELKPCPFCGNKDIIPADLAIFILRRYFMHCTKCGTSGPLSGGYEEESAGVGDALKRWNKRANDN